MNSELVFLKKLVTDIFRLISDKYERESFLILFMLSYNKLERLVNIWVCKVH